MLNTEAFDLSQCWIPTERHGFRLECSTQMGKLPYEANGLHGC